jgi:Na+-driven multidrug efflux pump
MMVLPTLGLCLTLTQMGLPSAVFKLTADKNYNNKKVIITSLSISLLNSIIMVGIIFSSASFIANNLLNSKDSLLAIYCIALFIPLASTNNLFRNYLLGQEKTIVPGFSQIIEEIVRIIVMLLLFLNFRSIPLALRVAHAFLAMIAGEIASSLFIVFFSNFKNKARGLLDSKITKMFLYKDIFSISLPVTGGQLLGSISNFLQPVILTYCMTALNFNSEFIKQQYGIINGYVISMLLIPSFINNVIYRIILPRFTKLIADKQIKKVRSEFIKTILICLFMGTPFSLLFYFAPEFCLKLFYSSVEGAEILKYAALPFIVFYIQTPISALLHAFSKNKVLLIISIIQCLLDIILLFILIPHYGVLSILIALLISLITTAILSGFTTYYYLFLQEK